jgi:hypothetical protein
VLLDSGNGWVCAAILLPIIYLSADYPAFLEIVSIE